MAASVFALEFDTTCYAGMADLDEFVRGHWFIMGGALSATDRKLVEVLGAAPDPLKYPQLARYYKHITSIDPASVPIFGDCHFCGLARQLRSSHYLHNALLKHCGFTGASVGLGWAPPAGSPFARYSLTSGGLGRDKWIAGGPSEYKLWTERLFCGTCESVMSQNFESRNTVPNDLLWVARLSLWRVWDLVGKNQLDIAVADAQSDLNAAPSLEHATLERVYESIVRERTEVESWMDTVHLLLLRKCYSNNTLGTFPARFNGAMVPQATLLARLNSLGHIHVLDDDPKFVNADAFPDRVMRFGLVQAPRAASVSEDVASNNRAVLLGSQFHVQVGGRWFILCACEQGNSMAKLMEERVDTGVHVTLRAHHSNTMLRDYVTTDTSGEDALVPTPGRPSVINLCNFCAGPNFSSGSGTSPEIMPPELRQYFLRKVALPLVMLMQWWMSAPPTEPEDAELRKVFYALQLLGQCCERYTPPPGGPEAQHEMFIKSLAAADVDGWNSSAEPTTTPVRESAIPHLIGSDMTTLRIASQKLHDAVKAGAPSHMTALVLGGGAPTSRVDGCNVSSSALSAAAHSSTADVCTRTEEHAEAATSLAQLRKFGWSVGSVFTLFKSLQTKRP